jgi:hypothetical protein
MSGEWVLAVLLSVNPGGDVPRLPGHMLAEFGTKEMCDHAHRVWSGLKARGGAVWDAAKAAGDPRLLDELDRQPVIVYSVAPCRRR